MSIKRLPPEAIETFSLVLHPKRHYSARVSDLSPGINPPVIALLLEDGKDLLTEAGDYLTTES